MAYDNIHLKLARETIAREGETRTDHMVWHRVILSNGEVDDVRVPLWTSNGVNHYKKWEDVRREVTILENRIEIKQLAEENRPALEALSTPMWADHDGQFWGMYCEDCSSSYCTCR